MLNHETVCAFSVIIYVFDMMTSLRWFIFLKEIIELGIKRIIILILINTSTSLETMFHQNDIIKISCQIRLTDALWRDKCVY